MSDQPINVKLRTGLSPEENAAGKKSVQLNPEASFPDPSLDKKEDKKFIIKVLDKIISFSIFMMFLGLPLFFTGLTWQGIVFEKQLYFYFCLLLGLVSWVSKGVITGELRIRRTPLDIPILGFLAVYIVSTVMSIDRWHSFWGSFADPSRGLISIIALTLAYYLLMSVIDKKKISLALIALIVSNFIVTVWTLLAILNVKFLPDSLAVFAPISLVGSIVGLGMFLAAMIILVTLAILTLARETDKSNVFRKICLAGLILLLGMNLFLILALYNFISWASLFAGIVVFLVFILSRIVRPQMSWTWLPMALFVAIMAIRMIGAVPIAKINFSEISPLDYQTSLDISTSSLKDNFLFGTGPATYGYNFSMYRPQEFNMNMLYNLRFLQGTGIIVESLSTIGGAGTFFLLIIILSFVSVELFLIARDKDKNKLLSLGFFSSTIILLVGTVALKAEGTMVILGVLLAALSLAVVFRESESAENYLNLSLKASPKFALTLAFIFMVVSAGVAFAFVTLGKIYAADVTAGRSIRQSATDMDGAIASMAKAINLNAKEGRYYTKLGEYYMILANTEAVKKEEERDVQRITLYLNNSIAAIQLGGNMLKKDVGAVETLAAIYENAGLYVVDSLNLALESYQKALELEPHNPNFYLKIGAIKIGLAGTKTDEAGKKQLAGEAREMFKKSVEVKSNFDPGYYQLSLIEDALGERDAAIDAGRRAVEINPQNVEYILSLGRLYQTRGSQEDLKIAEQIFKAVAGKDDKNVNAHFYLGLLHEKMKKNSEAKENYRKVMSLVAESDSGELKKQLEKMIANIDAGIGNTPENLGLIKKQEEETKESQE